MDSRRCRWLIDVLLGASVVAFLAVVEYGLVPNIPSGFYCGDPSISHKFTGDTISIGTLLLVTITIPLISLWVVEACNVSHDGYGVCSALKKRSASGGRLMWYWYKEYLVGLLAVLFITDAAKLLVGEPRPHFLDTCKPDLARNCTSGMYIQDFTCTGKDHSEHLIKDSTKSFPSGHASISVYTAIFMVWFTQRRVSKSISYLLVPWLQCLCLIWAMSCSFSRITDHRHHWWDVLAGSVLGVIGAYFTVLTFCAGFCPVTMINSQFPVRAANTTDTTKENGHVANGNRHQSVRRLLSSTSSYNGSISLEDKEPSEVPMA